MEKVNLQTADMVDENIKRIGELFPNCLTEVKDENGRPQVAIDFDQLRQELSKDIVEGPVERYQFTWPDKRNAIRLANAPTTDTLRPVRNDETTPTGADSEGNPYCSTGSVNFDTTENLYIEGDNLQVLKLLREDYLGKIKMIYIDPPYNTGKDFLYKDNRNLTQEQYSQNSGQTDKEGKRLVANPESNGRFHSDWINMIYPCLKIAKDLISDDGVIFISIDDNEQRNLKNICDEVFGESNWLITIAVNRTSEVATDKTIQKHEYCLVYAKSLSNLGMCGQKQYTISRGTVGNEDQTMPEIKFPKGLKCLNIADGTYSSSRQIPNSRENIQVLSPFIVKNGELAEDVVLKARWRSSNDMRNFFSNKCKPTKAKINGIIEEIYFDGDRFMPYIKKLVTEKIPSLFLENKRGSTDLESLNLNYFDFPKSVSTIGKFLSYVTGGDDIILDFFSGSSTTAHAVLNLNAEDGANRKFIMIQLPEVTAGNSSARKAGFLNICELGKERIRRAGKKIKEEHPDAEDLDIGFRVLKLDSSNMEDVQLTPKQYTQASLFADNLKPGRTEEDLLFQTMLRLGIDLSAKIETFNSHGKTVFNVNDNYLLACFDTDVNESAIEEIAKRQPIYFVMRDASLASDNVRDNIDQLWKHYNPGREKDLIII